ncbi:MAG: DUF1189 domain-containing protein [Caldicoprobacterales bacterium]|jgi:hypothetical protein|nr:DUF1189 domain-containing protein [Clostridiales bacterium]
MNLVQQFTNSLWNFRSYRSLSRMKGGKSFLYIFLLFLLIYVIGSTYTGAQFGNIIGHMQTALAENVPDFKLADGKFSFAGEMPYKISEDGFLMVIDTTGQTTLDDFKNVANGVLITEDEVSVVNMSRVETTPFSMMEPLEISKDQIIQFLPGLKVLLIIGMAFWFLFAFAGKLFGILLLSLIAMIATSMFQKRLTFLNQWNVAVYASTLPMLVKLLNSLSGGPLRGFMFVIYWGLAITYVFLGIYNMSDKNDESVQVMENPEISPRAE